MNPIPDPQPTNSPQEQDAPENLVELRRQRIQELQRKSLRHPDPLTACLGAMTSDLALFAFQYRESIAQEASSSAEGISLAALQPHVDTYLRFVRQIDRLSLLQREQPGDETNRRQ